MDKHKIFSDPVHGPIELPDLCVRIIDTPQFQRLRYVKQLGGGYYVYPGASHNRFEHSLGVCHLAGQFAEHLRSRQPNLGITDGDILCVKIAGLCHDIGHGPFSHVFDNKFIPEQRPSYTKKHEDVSVEMFAHLMKENGLEKELEPKDMLFIKEMIAGGPDHPDAQVWSYEGRDEDKSFLYEIVCNKRNGIDADKFDYFERDCHHLGIKSKFEHNRLMKLARAARAKVDGGVGRLQICFRDKEVGNIYDMFYTRSVLFRRAYQHKTTAIVEYMICEALKLADDHISFEGKEGPGEPVKMSEAIGDMVAFTELNDNVYLRILHSKDENLEPARKILQKIENRQLYRFIGQSKPPQKTDGKVDQKEWQTKIGKKMKELSSAKLTEDDIVVLVAKIDYGKGDENPVDYVKVYTKANPDEAIPVSKDQVSEIGPTKFREWSIRVYCKPECEEAVKTAKELFEEVCKSLDLKVNTSDDSAEASRT